MTNHSRVELRDLKLDTEIGTYGPGDVVPDAHVLDLTLEISPERVLIDADSMDRVFDYDPLIAEISRLAADGPYHTQERLMTRIVAACSAYEAILSLSLCLRKTPVLGTTGSLGVWLSVDRAGLSEIRDRARGSKT